MDKSKLARIGSAFLDVVRTRWPEFLPFASITEFGELRIEFPSPISPRMPVLWITTDVHSDEVIVGFGGGHSHGGPWDDPSSPDFAFAESVAFINAILRDEVVGCSLASGGGAIGYIDHMRDRKYLGKAKSIRSWSGDLDVDRG